MNFENLVINRRSIREYDDRPVSEDDVLKIINAGRWAPTAGNSQEIRYIVVRKKFIKERLAQAAFGQDWMVKAPVIIAVCANLEILEAKYGEMAYRYALCDGGAAIENMLLMATELGLGSCWVGAFDSEKVRTILGVPKHVKVIGLVTIGHYSKSVRIPIRRGLHDLIFYEMWGKKK